MYTALKTKNTPHGKFVQRGSTPLPNRLDRGVATFTTSWWMFTHSLCNGSALTTVVTAEHETSRVLDVLLACRIQTAPGDVALHLEPGPGWVKPARKRRIESGETRILSDDVRRRVCGWRIVTEHVCIHRCSLPFLHDRFRPAVFTITADENNGYQPGSGTVRIQALYNHVSKELYVLLSKSIFPIPGQDVWKRFNIDVVPSGYQKLMSRLSDWSGSSPVRSSDLPVVFMHSGRETMCTCA